MAKRITNEQLLEAIKDQQKNMCPADKTTYDKHCAFIDNELEKRDMREKVLHDTVNTLAKTANMLSELKDRVLVLETEKNAVIKMSAGIASGISVIITSVGGFVIWLIKHGKI